ncbi:hypothetical protein B0H19DRAFT_972426, partial [Mycena capillaripes]
MVNAAKKFGVKFDTTNPSKDIREMLPLWHHFGEDPNKRQLNNKPQCKCLRKNHRVYTVGEGLVVMARLDDPAHDTDRNCVCEACYDDRVKNKCKNPHSCATTVRMRLDQLLPEWDPRTPEVDHPSDSDEDESDSYTFKPPKGITSLTDGFRVFTNEPREPELEEAAPPTRIELQEGEDQLVISLSGSTINSGLADARSGWALVHGIGDPRNEAGALPAPLEQTTSNAELVAAIVATQKAPKDVPLRLES